MKKLILSLVLVMVSFVYCIAQPKDFYFAPSILLSQDKEDDRIEKVADRHFFYFNINLGYIKYEIREPGEETDIYYLEIFSYYTTEGERDNIYYYEFLIETNTNELSKVEVFMKRDKSWASVSVAGHILQGVKIELL